jgi:hypothetical protein
VQIGKEVGDVVVLEGRHLCAAIADLIGDGGVVDRISGAELGALEQVRERRRRRPGRLLVV